MDNALISAVKSTATYVLHLQTNTYDILKYIKEATNKSTDIIPGKNTSYLESHNDALLDKM